jgi:ABC-type Na+ efflux pump permease subunit
MGFFIAIILTNHLVLKIIVAGEAAGTLDEERHSERLEYLLSCTPLSPREIIRGQWLAILRQVVRPMVFVVTLDLVLLGFALGRASNSSDPDGKLGFTTLVLSELLMLVVDTIALGWIGMWQAMSQRRARHASGSTVGIVFVVPLVPFFVVVAILAFYKSRLLDYFPTAVALWVFASLCIELPTALYAKHFLKNRFRLQAATYGQEKIGLFAQLGRWLGNKTRGQAAQ